MKLLVCIKNGKYKEHYGVIEHQEGDLLYLLVILKDRLEPIIINEKLSNIIPLRYVNSSEELYDITSQVYNKLKVLND